MNILNIIFPIIFICFFVAILFILLTEKGRRSFVRIWFGNIIKDHGDLGRSKVGGVNQTLHLYECSRGKEKFFVLETRILMNAQYAKVSFETAQNFIKAVSSANPSL